MVARYLVVTSILIACPNCNTQVGTLDLTIQRSWDKTQEPLEQVASFVRLRVDGPDLLVGPKIFSFVERSGRLDEVPVGENRRITFEGLGP